MHSHAWPQPLACAQRRAEFSQLGTLPAALHSLDRPGQLEQVCAGGSHAGRADQCGDSYVQLQVGWVQRELGAT